MTEVEEGILGGVCRVVVYTSRAMKIKEHLPFCKEFSTLFIEDRNVVDRVVSL